MIIRIGFDVQLEVPSPTPMVLMLFVHPSRRADLRLEEKVIVDPDVAVSRYIDMYGNTCGRLFVPAGHVRFKLDTLIRDTGKPDPQSPDAAQHPVDKLPDSTLAFLMPSRFCEVDKLKDEAGKLFGSTSPGWSRVQAICDWAHREIQFANEFADATHGAVQIYQDRKGVARDHAHLAIAFCRAMQIPARYVIGYLSNVGERNAPGLTGFAEWLEVYLGETWHVFDPFRNARRIGRIPIAVGRDAADVAAITSFGTMTYKKREIVAEEAV